MQRRFSKYVAATVPGSIRRQLRQREWPFSDRATYRSGSAQLSWRRCVGLHGRLEHSGPTPPFQPQRWQSQVAAPSPSIRTASASSRGPLLHRGHDPRCSPALWCRRRIPRSASPRLGSALTVRSPARRRARTARLAPRRTGRRPAGSNPGGRVSAQSLRSAAPSPGAGVAPARIGVARVRRSPGLLLLHDLARAEPGGRRRRRRPWSRRDARRCKTRPQCRVGLACGTVGCCAVPQH